MRTLLLWFLKEIKGLTTATPTVALAPHAARTTLKTNGPFTTFATEQCAYLLVSVQ